MHILNMEQRAYEMMVARLKTLADRVEKISKERGDMSLKNWLDNHDVCMLLNVSLRTLQSYRDAGKIGYSQIGHKIYYRPEDVEQLLKSA